MQLSSNIRPCLEAPIRSRKPNVVKHRNERLPTAHENLSAHRARTKPTPKKWPSSPSPAYVFSPGLGPPNDRQSPLPRLPEGKVVRIKADKLVGLRCSAGASSPISELPSVSSLEMIPEPRSHLGHSSGGMTNHRQVSGLSLATPSGTATHKPKPRPPMTSISNSVLGTATTCRGETPATTSTRSWRSSAPRSWELKGFEQDDWAGTNRRHDEKMDSGCAVKAWERGDCLCIIRIDRAGN